MNKYIKIYHERNVKLALLCSFVASAPLLVACLFSDADAEDFLISLIPFVVAASWVAVASLYTIRFKRMIKKQEQLYNIRFQDTDVTHLENKNILYLSKEWLIWAGSGAFYKKHIKSIRNIRRSGRAGLPLKVVIKTVDNKRYSFWCSSSCVKKIRKWKKT